MRTSRPAGRHQFLRSGAAVGITCLALLAGTLVGGIQAAEAATIPDNPCVPAPPSPPPPITSRPLLTRVSMSTATVDVRRRAKRIVVTLQVRDTVAVNLVRVVVSRYPPKRFAMAARARLVAGTATAGTWKAIITVRTGVPDGRYRLSRVWLEDVGNASATYTPRSSAAGAWPAPFRVRSHTDRTAPVVTDFRVSARAVDTRVSTTTISLRVDARDVSGVESVFVDAEGVDRTLEPAESAYHGFTTHLTRSTTHKHRWTGRAVVPMWVGIGTWTFRVHAKDNRRHWRDLRSSALARRGWQSTMRVTSGRDAVPPTLVALSFIPTSVDARDGAVRVEVTARVTDALSGPAGGLPVNLIWATTALTSISGTPNDRTYHGYALVPQCGIVPQSTMLVEAHLADRAGNLLRASSDELAALGFPTELSVRQRDGQGPVVYMPSLRAGGPLVLGFNEPVIMASPLAATLRVVVNGSTASGAWECRNGSGTMVVCDADGAAVIAATFTPTAAFTAGDEIVVLPTSSPPARIGIYDLDGAPLYEVDLAARIA